MPSENENRPSNKRRGTTRGRGNRERRHRSRSPKDTTAVPKLKHGADNNYPAFKKKIAVAALKEFGDLGRMFDLGGYYEPEAIDMTLYDLENDPHRLNLDELKGARKERARAIAKMKSDHASMFAFMMQHLSNESLDAIKLEDDWDDADTTKDPLTLWGLIETTHRVAIASRIPMVLKAEARRAYQAVGQSAYESIVKFKERFDGLLENYNEQANPEMEAGDIAMDFFRALDSTRYADFKINLLNSISSGAIDQPETLNDMYTQAANYLVATRSTPLGGNRAVFATTSDAPSRRGGRGNQEGRGSHTGRGGKGRGRGGGGRGRGDSGGGQAKSGQAKSPVSRVECWGCGEAGHMLRDCPSVETVDSGEERGGSAHVTTYQINMISEKSTEWWEVLLDNQAQISVVDPRILTNIRRMTEPAKIGGITGHHVEINMIGRLTGFFDVLCDHSTGANVLCMADVEDKYPVV